MPQSSQKMEQCVAPAQKQALGVLLINTGTADSPDVEAIARYLNDFLMDPDIICAPWPIRRLIVNKIIKTRPSLTVERYRTFWTEEGSPFLLTSLKQGQLLQEELSDLGATVAVAMRYGNPSIKNALQELQSKGCTRLVVLPCYPQYVNVCAGTCFKAVRKELKNMAWQPEVLEVTDFYNQPAYRQALAESVRKVWTPADNSKLVVSCHSTLLKDIEAGDPYRDQVEATAAHLAEDLGLEADAITVSYQSRFDSRKWLQPATKTVVEGLAQRGSDVTILCPIFTADNIETAYDIAIMLKQLYCEQAPEGCTFTFVPCLNEDPLLIKALAAAVTQVL